MRMSDSGGLKARHLPNLLYCLRTAKPNDKKIDLLGYIVDDCANRCLHVHTLEPGRVCIKSVMYPFCTAGVHLRK